MMDAAQNTSRNSRDLILDAAEALVSELGAARLTIDAVAARSGLSKGGVLYNFPSKDALIKGMVARLIEDCASDVADLRPRFEDHDSPTLAALVTAAPGWISAKKSVARALLAAHAENPALLQPFCEFKKTQKAQILSEAKSPADALMMWSAIEGVVFTSALGLNVHSEAEIETMLCGMREKIRG